MTGTAGGRVSILASIAMVSPTILVGARRPKGLWPRGREGARFMRRGRWAPWRRSAAGRARGPPPSREAGGRIFGARVPAAARGDHRQRRRAAGGAAPDGRLPRPVDGGHRDGKQPTIHGAPSRRRRRPRRRNLLRALMPMRRASGVVTPVRPTVRPAPPVSALRGRTKANAPVSVARRGRTNHRSFFKGWQFSAIDGTEGCRKSAQ